MSMKRQLLRSEYFQAPVCHSLAGLKGERAIAEGLGGCIWPPRSYSCSFCMKEFRSAQALGGHMNVHRRDRARLKQQNLNTQSPDDQNPLITSLEAKHPVLDHNPVNNPFPGFVVSPSKFSALSTTHENVIKELAFVSSPHKNLQEQPRKPDEAKNNKEQVKEYSLCMAHDDDRDDQVRTDLSVGLNSVFCRNPATGTSCRDEAAISCKRAKTNLSRVPFLNVSNEKYSFKFEVLGVLKPTSKINHEDLDLELRLGADPSLDNIANNL